MGGDGPSLSALAVRLVRHKLAAEIGLLALIGLFLGLIGPFGSTGPPNPVGLAYWQINIVGGGLIGIAIDSGLRRIIRDDWPRVVTTAFAMTPPVTLLVLLNNALLLSHDHAILWRASLNLSWQVFVIALPVMVLRLIVWRRPERIVEERTIVAPPLPEAEAVFRRRLSAKRRTAKLIAIEAHDHFLKVHTDCGEELVTARFADAIAELALAHGYQIHRSWWISADAIETVRLQRGSGQARLVGGLTAPVSRSFAPVLREAGWL